MLVHRVVLHVLPMRPAYQSQIKRPDEFYSFGLAVLVRGVENFSLAHTITIKYGQSPALSSKIERDNQS
jgi:hypothetical protein